MGGPPAPALCMIQTKGAIAMPINRALQGRVFSPDELQVLTTAFEQALRELRLVDRSDPATEMVAKKIIELADEGERDPVRLRERTVHSFGRGQGP